MKTPGNKAIAINPPVRFDLYLEATISGTESELVSPASKRRRFPSRKNMMHMPTEMLIIIQNELVPDL